MNGNRKLYLQMFSMKQDMPMLWIYWIATACTGLTLYAQDTTPPDFNRDIRPILSDNCFACHGPDAAHRKGKLRLDLESDAKSDLRGSRAIVEGHPDQSEIITRIQSQEPDLRMPPPDSGKTLEQSEIRQLTDWIQSGAPWSDHWAYVPPVQHPLPVIDNPTRAQNWIDLLIQKALDSKDLQLSETADEITLLRRIYFDLIGMPPGPEEVRDYLSDPSKEKFTNKVNALLASEHYGERMAIYWLDLVRYADTVGYHGDQDHNISPYRDYVIDSFNSNKPFDHFTREQLAGDLIPERGVEGKIASGYNRLLQTSHEGGVQPKEYLAIYAADRVRNLSSVWMGATIGCAQCHDHKYDPFSMRDFYSLSAFFADIDEEGHFTRGTNDLPTQRPPEIEVLTRKEMDILQSLESHLDRLDEKKAHANHSSPLHPKNTVNNLIQQTRDAQRKTMITVALEEPRVTRVFPRGNWLDDSGDIVNPGVPASLGLLPGEKSRYNRLDLANWLTDPEKGVGYLTARVMVNRLWYLFMGSGLAPDLDDFGGQGAPPTHPELLDNLAIAFVDSGWDVKEIIRLITSSHTYQQSSRPTEDHRSKDPQNSLYSRQTTKRLPAEMIRDTLLKVSGLLNPRTGGPSVKPYQPEGYYRHLNFPVRTYASQEDSRQYRRGVYVHWQRQFLHPMLKAFDAVNREECTAQRPTSNTPIAALALLNDPSSIEAARVFAERLVNENPDGNWLSQLEYAWECALSRKPDPFEIQVMTELYHTAYKQAESHPDQAKELLNVGFWPTPPKNQHTQIAALTAVTRALFNLNETVTRN